MSAANAESGVRVGPAVGRKGWIIEGNRLMLDLTDEGVEALNQLLSDLGDPPELLFRKALGLLRYTLDAQREGKYVGVVADPDVLETEFVNE